MLRLHVRRRLSERLDGVDHGPGGSIDKLLMTWVEQTVGAAALSVAGSRAVIDGDDVALKIYLYSRAQSVMGGTSQIQKNIIATRILGLPVHESRLEDRGRCSRPTEEQEAPTAWPTCRALPRARVRDENEESGTPSGRGRVESTARAHRAALARTSSTPSTTTCTWG